jgi:hypothetical protein
MFRERVLSAHCGRQIIFDALGRYRLIPPAARLQLEIRVIPRGLALGADGCKL